MDRMFRYRFISIKFKISSGSGIESNLKEETEEAMLLRLLATPFAMLVIRICLLARLCIMRLASHVAA